MNWRFDRKIASIMLSLAILVTIPGCTIFTPATPSPVEREAEEYAVYRTILGELTIAGDDGGLCIENHTLSGVEASPDFLPGLDPKLIEDYNTQNKESVPVKPEMDLGVPLVPSGDYYAHSDCEYAEVCVCDFQAVSRVGFNARLNKALIYWERNAPLAGRGIFFYLVKGKDGNWKIEEDILQWIS